MQMEPVSNFIVPQKFRHNAAHRKHSHSYKPWIQRIEESKQRRVSCSLPSTVVACKPKAPSKSQPIHRVENRPPDQSQVRILGKLPHLEHVSDVAVNASRVWCFSGLQLSLKFWEQGGAIRPVRCVDVLCKGRCHSRAWSSLGQALLLCLFMASLFGLAQMICKGAERQWQ